ncbi:MAG: hypothetical protein AAB037_01620, partial [Chloroflexota bacterium]
VISDQPNAEEDGWLGWGRESYGWNLKPALVLKSGELKTGRTLTVRLRDLGPEHRLGSFTLDSMMMIAGLASRKTGTDPVEKDAIYEFFKRQLRYAVSVSTDPFYAEQLRKLEDPGLKADWLQLANEPQGGHNHDTVVHEWMTRSALALLPQGYEEVREHAAEILEGVKGEDARLRPLSHFYNPHDPENKMTLGEQALKWGAIGHPDNPENEWDWQDAQRYYKDGDKRKAYKALGHVLHILEDLSVPMHTRIIAHNYNLQPSAARFETYFSELAEKHGQSLPPIYSIQAVAPKPVRGLVEHFDDLAKLSFGVHMVDRQSVDFDAFYTWEKGKLGTQMKEPGESDIELMGRHLFPKAIEYSAGLLEEFHGLMHPKAFVQASGIGKDGGGGTEQSIEKSTATLAASQQGVPPEKPTPPQELPELTMRKIGPKREPKEHIQIPRADEESHYHFYRSQDGQFVG